MKLIPVLGLLAAFTVPAFSEGREALKAEFDWKMNCQGCHQADASGSEGGAPDMRGVVARFLSVEGGREYLVQVPGAAYAPVNDEELAALLNWLLVEYDKDDLPADFKPYSGKEVGSLRKAALMDEAATTRAALIEKFEGPKPHPDSYSTKIASGEGLDDQR
ncbi:c-type cytochrome [Kordiimonas pumila]|uniref:C-type cytochrome n=1 Tax=Kordiimonas pumila TaxID=2161677 RepID=A0ABV7D578_9PROT|nr:cytochrome c [Kordiimonas pumila]